jgi:hypothetical protein
LGRIGFQTKSLVSLAQSNDRSVQAENVLLTPLASPKLRKLQQGWSRKVVLLGE